MFQNRRVLGDDVLWLETVKDARQCSRSKNLGS